MIHFGPEWPGDAVAIFPVLVQMADDGKVDLSFVVVEDATGEAVGAVGTKGSVSADGVVEIGYGMNPSVFGKGYGTESVGAQVVDLLARPDVVEVTAETAVANVASHRVLEKNGFTRVGEGWNEDDGELFLWKRTALGVVA